MQSTRSSLRAAASSQRQEANNDDSIDTIQEGNEERQNRKDSKPGRPAGMGGASSLGNLRKKKKVKQGPSPGKAKLGPSPGKSKQAVASAGAGAGASNVGGSQSRDGVPVSTVVEAQESGEQAHFRDEAVWALDGLHPGTSQATIHESLATLVEVCTNRRGRVALKSAGIAEDVLAALGELHPGDDAVMALGMAALVLAFCQPDADPALLEKGHVAKMISSLLQTRTQVTREQCSPSSLCGRIIKPLQELPYVRAIPREASYSPLSVTLTALSDVLNPHQSTINTDPFKNALRQHEALLQVAQLAVEQSQALVDSSPTMETVQSLWRLQKSLLVLENSCFACAENETYLVKLTLKQGLPPLVKTVQFVQWVVQQIKAVVTQGLLPGLKKDCLRVFVAVLMNLTQNNDDGCGAVVAAQGLTVLSQLLCEIAHGDAQRTGCLEDIKELDAWVDELSGCLGVLINLAEHSPNIRLQLRDCTCALRPGSKSATASGTTNTQLIPLLCRLVVGGDHVEGASSAGNNADMNCQPTPDEVTVDSLETGEGEGAGLIVEVYAAILLGFLIEGDMKSQREAAAMLPGGSLDPVIAAVARCLQFYINAGAITSKTEESLRKLLVSLKETKL